MGIPPNVAGRGCQAASDGFAIMILPVDLGFFHRVGGLFGRVRLFDLENVVFLPVFVAVRPPGEAACAPSTNSSPLPLKYWRLAGFGSASL